MTIEELADLLPPRYRVKREIGRGGMATVYLADDVQESREVAIKVLSGELGSSLDATRFEREIKIAGELQHPNILRAYDSGSAKGMGHAVKLRAVFGVDGCPAAIPGVSVAASA